MCNWIEPVVTAVDRNLWNYAENGNTIVLDVYVMTAPFVWETPQLISFELLKNIKKQYKKFLHKCWAFLKFNWKNNCQDWHRCCQLFLTKISTVPYISQKSPYGPLYEKQNDGNIARWSRHCRLLRVIVSYFEVHIQKWMYAWVMQSGGLRLSGILVHYIRNV